MYAVANAQSWFGNGDPPAGEVKILLARVVLGDCQDFGALCTSFRGDSFADAQKVSRGLKDFWKEGKHRNRAPAKDLQDKNSALYHSVSGTEGDLSWSRNPMLSGNGATLGRQYVVFDAAQAYPFLLITLSRGEKSNPSADEGINDLYVSYVSDLSADELSH